MKARVANATGHPENDQHSAGNHGDFGDTFANGAPSDFTGNGLQRSSDQVRCWPSSQVEPCISGTAMES